MLVSLPYWLFQMMRHGKYRTGFGGADGASAGPARIFPARSRRFGCTRFRWERFSRSRGWWRISTALPGIRIFVSTTTDTGQALARKRFGEENVFYFPMDFAFAIRPYLRALRPEMVVIAETEFWPNFMRLAHAQRGADCGGQCADLRSLVAEVPALSRIAAKVAGRTLICFWRRRKKMRRGCAILARSRTGAGYGKFEIRFARARSRRRLSRNLRQSLAARAAAGPVLVCGSTVEGEEPLLLKAFENLRVQHPEAVMILAPRHPERFQQWLLCWQQMSIAFRRRSEWNGETLNGGRASAGHDRGTGCAVRLADVAFVGGSLVPRGGHNIIEPAQHGVAIVVGNHTENFRDIVHCFRAGMR